MNGPLKSPCVRNCCLDDKDICLGCFRHLDEITGWCQMIDKEKETVLKLACKRKKGYTHLTRFY